MEQKAISILEEIVISEEFRVLNNTIVADSEVKEYAKSRDEILDECADLINLISAIRYRETFGL